MELSRLQQQAENQWRIVPYGKMRVPPDVLEKVRSRKNCGHLTIPGTRQGRSLFFVRGGPLARCQRGWRTRRLYRFGEAWINEEMAVQSAASD